MHRQKLLFAAVVGHLFLTALHGLVHVAIPVFPNGWIAAFAMVSLYILPVVGAGLVVRGYQGAGAAILFCAGIASFAFEGMFHFFITNPDHIAHVPDHRMSFSVTAVLTTIGNLLLVWGAWLSVQDTSSSGYDISSTVKP